MSTTHACRGRTGTSTLTPTGTADGDSSVPAKASASFDMSRVSPLVTELRNMVLEEKDFVGTKAAYVPSFFGHGRMLRSEFDAEGSSLFVPSCLCMFHDRIPLNSQLTTIKPPIPMQSIL
jgi:hypothetical protein